MCSIDDSYRRYGALRLDVAERTGRAPGLRQKKNRDCAGKIPTRYRLAETIGRADAIRPYHGYGIFSFQGAK